MAYLGNPSRTAEVLKKYQFHFQKKFGQNFLIDGNILEKIVNAARITEEDCVLEIGPGIGTMTQYLAERAKSVIAVEVDKNLIPVLRDTLSSYQNVKVINEDILKVDVGRIVREENGGRPIKVVANLPYYITSPILMNLLASPVEWATICVMMQKEVAQRLIAKPGTKQYGALTLAIEYQMQAKIAFDVSRKVFVPSPNVDSAIVVLTPRTNPLPVQPFDKQKLFGFIRGCFAHRRKSLWNNLQSVIGKDPGVKEKMTAVLAQLDISPQIRPEKLTLEQFIELANALHQQNLL